MRADKDKCLTCGGRYRQNNLDSPSDSLRKDGTFMGLPYWFCSVECYKKKLRPFIKDGFDFDKEPESDEEYVERVERIQEEYHEKAGPPGFLMLFRPVAWQDKDKYCRPEIIKAYEAFHRRKLSAILSAELELSHRLDAEWEHERAEEDAANQKIADKQNWEIVRLIEEKAREEAHDAEIDELLRTKPIPEETRFSGTWICSPQGRGKTTLLHTLIMADLEKDASLIIMDSKGDLIGPISKLKHIQDRLIIIDPTNPIAINPLDVPKANIRTAVAHLEYIFSALLEAKITPKQQALFRSVLRALLIAWPNPTLETFRDIITNGIGAYRPYITNLPPDLQDFFNKEFDRDYDATRNELVWRLRLLLENDVIRTMFTAPVSKFNIGAAMDAGKVIIINNSQALLDADGAEFFGRFFIGQVWAAATARSLRPASEKRPCYFYIDECQTVIRRDKKVAAIIDECRSQKIALHLSHQRMKQIEDSDVLSAMSNCAIRYTNSDDEAKAFAPIMRCTPEFLQTLTIGWFGVFVRDLTSHPFVLVVEPIDFNNYETMTRADSAKLAQDTKGRYGVTATAPETHEAAPAIAVTAPTAVGAHLHRTVQHPVAEVNKSIVPPKDIDPSAPSKWTRK